MAATKRRRTGLMQSGAALLLPPLAIVGSAPQCSDARLIIAAAHESADALLKAYDLARQQRGRPRGMTTDKEQDLLRSMLVMAAAGLDATTKRLIEDALPTLVSIDAKSQNSFEKFIARRLESTSSKSNTSSAAQFLAVALASRNPQARLIEEYVRTLTSGSLQSVASLFEVTAALGVDPSKIGLNADYLKPVFHARNMIVHELDIDLSATRRTRVVRSQRDMIRFSTALLKLAAALVKSVDERLSAVGDGGVLEIA